MRGKTEEGTEQDKSKFIDTKNSLMVTIKKSISAGDKMSVGGQLYGDGW